MKPVCEIMTQYVLPSVRALIARDLIEKHKLTQKEAARRLGMTQPAVSQYKKHTRGYRVKVIEKNRKINEKIEELAESIANRELNVRDATLQLCEICRTIRKDEMVCELHKENFPEMAGCDICLK